MYIMRLDDASENMCVEKWERMVVLLDKYGIKPIYGIIPKNQDPDLIKYQKDNLFWEKMRLWQGKGWVPALHGYTHVFKTKNSGINPVNNRSEFAGVCINQQKDKIKKGYNILIENGIHPQLFFAPAHTFDLNTLKAIRSETDIKVISDTVATNVYYENDFYFIPQQTGKCRLLPFKIVTFCYHPNNMTDEDFAYLENFLLKHSKKFMTYNNNLLVERRKNSIDKLINYLYFLRRKK